MVAKLTFLLLCITIVQASAAQTVSLNVRNEKLENVLKEIKRQTRYDYVLNARFAGEARTITINTSGDLNQVLTKCLQDQPFTYEITDKIIVIKEKPTPRIDTKTEATAPLPGPPPPVIIKGKVTNENGEPVAGATVSLKGGKAIGITNNNGEFSVSVPDPNAILVFSAVTIETLEVKANGKTDLTVGVISKVTALQDVEVSKGYYSVKQQANTGTVSVVKGEDIQKQPVSNPLAALEGRVTGLYIQQRSGLPGDGFTVRLRGQNSIANGNDPLYIVDGVPFSSSSPSQSNATIINSPFNYLNPSDIDNITVLKDADATAIYGSRGANGVVLITTKKGKAGGRNNVDVNFYQGIGQVGHFVNMLNTKQYLQMRNEAFKNDNNTPAAADYDVNGTWDSTRYTDWQRTLIGGNAQYTDLQFSLSGGNANTQFLMGAGYHRETSVFPGDLADTKSSAHFNLNHVSPNKLFRANLSLNYLIDNNQLITNDLTSKALSFAPDAPALYKADGSLNWAGSSWTNPLSYLLITYKPKSYNFISHGQFSYEVIPNLFIRTSLGYNSINFSESRIVPIASNDPAKVQASPAVYTGASTFGYNNSNSWIIEPQLDYRKQFNFGQLSFLIGTTFQENTIITSQITGTGFTSDALLQIVQAAPTRSGSNGFTDYRYNAVFGRIGYDYQGKYFLNLTARRDGSSRFGPGKQFGNFGAVGAAWIFTKEKFMQQLSFLSYGKIRASYGVTGNDQTGDYKFLDTYSATTNPYQGNSGLFPTSLYNGDFGWETNRKLEGGLDLGFLKDRILFGISYYRNRSDNQLVGYPLPPSTGGTSITANLPALIQNMGAEFELNTINIKNNDFSWSSLFNISFPGNVLVDYPNIAGSSYANKYVIGQSLFLKKAFHYLGQDPQTGLFMFDTKNANGVPTSPGDLQAHVNLGQEFFGGFLNAFRYKNWQLDIFFQFVKQTDNLFYTFTNIPGRMANQPVEVTNRWQNPGDNTGYEPFLRLTTLLPGQRMNAYISSDAMVTDGSFVRLKNVSLSYNLPAKLLQSMHLQRLRIYFQAQNLFTITRYIGLDPEQTSWGSLPSLRAVTGGIQIGL